MKKNKIIRKNSKNQRITAFMFTAFIAMIIINGLANIIPYNGVTTEEVTNLFFVLFTPAPYVFSIWYLIYFGLFIWMLGISLNKQAIDKTVGTYFIISCILNSIWLILWHYCMPGSSLLTMAFLLICLLSLYTKEKNKSVYTVVFSIYFAWVLISFFINLSYYLVAVHQVSDNIQMTSSIILLFVGLGIASLMLYIFKDRIFGLVVVWTYIGIFVHNYLLYTTLGISSLILAGILLVLIATSYLKKYKIEK